MLKAKIEAVLFLTDKPMKAQVIARTLNVDINVVRQGLLELVHDYEERKSGLEISNDNGYIIQVKDEYSSLINEFAPLEMPVALLRTLSAIAIKQPVQQSEIIKIRGAGAYDHIKELIVRELIIKKEADEGRSPLLSTTKNFQEYFRLSGDGKTLRAELRKEKKPTAGEAPAMETAGTTDSPTATGDETAAEEKALKPSLPELTHLEEIFASSPDTSVVFRADPRGDKFEQPAGREGEKSHSHPVTETDAT